MSYVCISMQDLRQGQKSHKIFEATAILSELVLFRPFVGPGVPSGCQQR